MPWRIFLLSAAITACAQPPTKEVEIASRRIEQAREAGASTYAADLLQQAEDALVEAQEALSHPQGYRQAVEAAAAACVHADQARVQASEDKERIHREAGRILKECEVLMEQAGSLAVEETTKEKLASFSLRHGSLVTILEAGKVSDAYDGAYQLKDELLAFLRRLE